MIIEFADLERDKQHNASKYLHISFKLWFWRSCLAFRLDEELKFFQCKVVLYLKLLQILRLATSLTCTKWLLVERTKAAKGDQLLHIF